ncbi:MAG TPA: rod shape-determining protein MreC [Gammaproteobacteria bacterium]|nr:rod shape-determining protein MreC [Gammaproteobacteria bacterium]
MRSIFTYQSRSGLRTFLFFLISIMLMVMDKRMESFTLVRSALSVPIAPLQYMVSEPIQIFAYLKNIINTHDKLVSENLQLKANELLLQSQLQRLLAIESENNYLKSLLQSSHHVKEKMKIAEVLSVRFEPYMHRVVLNKGSQDGVYLGQPVLDANGIMGQVVQVGPITSEVLLINDPQSGISVQNTRTGVRAVVVGDSYSSNLRLMFVSKTTEIKQGDFFITSGLGGHYPEGYPVGKVVSVSQDPASQFAEVILQPSAHLESTRQVLLIWYQKHA